MSIGTRIKERREELGLTQQELADRMGYKSKVSISNVEHDHEDLTSTRVQKFAKALETTPAYLMGWQSVGDVMHALLSGNREDISQEEKTMLDHFRRITPQTQKIVTNIIDTEYAEIIEKEKNQNSAS